jgi:hypothetical protein
MRDETEWVETLEWGNQLVGLSKQKIIRALKDIDSGKVKTRKISYKVKGARPSDLIVKSVTAYLDGR